VANQDGFLSIRDGNGTIYNQKGELYYPLSSVFSGKVLSTTSGDFYTIGKLRVVIQESIPRDIFEKETQQTTHKPSTFEITNPEKKMHRISSVRLRPQSSRFDPTKESAIVMPRMDPFPGVDIVVDPVIGKHLRAHQVEGVKFMYSCLLGLTKTPEGSISGCILADEMGLGKTLQSIALIWTLLKQSPFQGQSSVIKRALIVCPASLTQNWKREFQKWLGDIRIHVFVVDPAATSVSDFFLARRYQVMIIGYEKLQKFREEILAGQFDLCICDEGHRLKNGDVQAAQTLSLISTKKRVILSGTPVQNDLLEFYHMVQFVNPGFLGTAGNFKRAFENDIMLGKQSDCTSIQQRIGEEKLELVCLTNVVIPNDETLHT
jgi:DNA repair and recombination protein RAD54B